MAILNGDITLAQFNSTYVYNRRHPKDFFRGHAATSRDLLPSGTVLWKCSDHPLSPANAVTEWWVHGDHLTVALQHCLNLGVSLQRYCRARYAVVWEWRSAASNLLRARLLQPVYGFAGQTLPVDTKYSVRGQDTGLGNLTLIGGDPQLCIPNLALSVIAQLSLTASDTVPAGWNTRRAPSIQSSDVG